MVRLTDGGIRCRPRAALTDTLRAAVLEHKSELLAVLEPTHSAPATACWGCSTVAWFWEADWLGPGEGRWFCRACCTRLGWSFPIEDEPERAAGEGRP